MKQELAAEIMTAVKNNKRLYLEECGIKGTDESILYLKIVGKDDKVISLEIK